MIKNNTTFLIIQITFILLLKFSTSQVLLNEIMLKPNSDATSQQFQSLKVCSQVSYGGEYIELYNANSCQAVDISCYMIGFRIWNNQSDGTFRFPTGTIIPPLGFLSIGGPNSGATINLFDFCSDSHLQTGADRWYLENGDAYVAFYDENGNPIDAVYWTSNENEANKWATDSDLDESPSYAPIAGGCPNVASLVGPSSPELTAVVDYAGKSPQLGLVIHRTIDGGATWSTDASPSLNNCNSICQSGSPFFINASIINPSCGLSNGEINLSPSPADNYSFSWLHDAQLTTGNATNLTQNTYSVNVSNGTCSKDTTIVLIESAPYILNPIVVQTSCSLGNGSIELNPSPSNNYSYSWSHDLQNTSNTSSNLTPGTYSISISDGSCVKDTNITILSSTNFHLNPSISAVTCAQNDGVINFNPTPANNYTFQWSHDSNLTGQVASQLPSGSYTVTVSDGSCVKDTIVILDAPVGCCNLVLQATITSVPNSNCNGISNACDYSGPSILINEINLAPQFGDGSMFGQGVNGQSQGEWIELYNPNWCDSIDISGYVLGTYNSTGDAVIPSAFGMGFVLPPNTKVPPLGFVVVRGINAPTPPLGTIDIVLQDEDGRLCIDGGIGVSRFWFQNAGSWFAFYDRNGIPQDVISWGSPTSTDLDFEPCIPPTNSLPLGTNLPSYNMTGLGINLGPSSVGLTYVRIPDGGNWSSTMMTENSSYGSCNVQGGCNNQTGATSTCNGEAIVTLNNGQAPYTFIWNDDLTQRTQNADSLCSGTYQLTVTDINGCLGTFTVDITEDFFDLSITSTQPSCNNNDGAIDVTTTPSNGNYTYNWSANTNISNNSTSLASSLAGGTYQLTVSNGDCLRDTSITLIQPPQITDVDLTISDEFCNQNNGSITINSVSGGTQAYQYNLNGQGFTSSLSFLNLSDGTYQLIIQDQNGCTFNENQIIINNVTGPTDINLSSQNEICSQANGQITINQIIGGTSPYLVNFNNEGTTTLSLFENLNADEYSISITDANNCSYEEIVLIQNDLSSTPTSLTSLISYPNCGLTNGSLTISQIIGGNEPITTIIDGKVSPDGKQENLGIGSYEVELIDNSGCKFDTVLVIDQSIGQEYLLIPNIFTPNEDSKNNTWFVTGSCVKEFSCTILNRWGNQIVTLNNIIEPWEGKSKGDLVSEGVYFYLINVLFESGEAKTYQGNITVIYN